MTLNAKIGGFMDFLGDFGLRDISRANCTEFTTDSPRRAAYEIFSIEHRFPSFSFLSSRKPAHEGIKERYPIKVVILPLLASLPWKRLQMGMDMLPITTSTSHEFLSRINIYDFERPWTPKIKGFIVFLQFSAALRTSRVKCDEID